MSDVQRIWIRAAACESSGCLEIAFDEDRVYLRNSTDPAGTITSATREEWELFANAVRNDEFEAA
jgi:hypothetical protein